MPLVSVIMACHNAARYVGEAIRSVTGQTFTDLELVIVDDKSTDDSLQVAATLAQSDKRVSVYSSQLHLGASAARNLAIEKSIGEWLAILDADDVFLRDKLEKQVALVKSAREQPVLVGTGCFQIDSLGRRIGVYKYPSASSDLKGRLIRLRAFPPHSSLMYRSSVARSIGCFNSLFIRAEDYDFALRISRSGAFLCIEEPLVEYRLHSTNVSRVIASTGYLQLDYGVAAGVCHMLRERGEFDPSAGRDPVLWDRFMRHVATYVRASGELEYRNWKELWGPTRQLSGGQVINAFLVFKGLLLNPVYASRLIKEHTIGTPIVTNCLESWLRTSTCAAL